MNSRDTTDQLSHDITINNSRSNSEEGCNEYPRRQALDQPHPLRNEQRNDTDSKNDADDAKEPTKTGRVLARHIYIHAEKTSKSGSSARGS